MVQMYLISLALVASASFVAANQQRLPFECTGAIQVDSLSTLDKGPCGYLTGTDQQWGEYLDKTRGAIRLDIIQTCTCNLLRQELAWKSFITHELSTLFLASKDMVLANVASNPVDDSTPSKELLANLGEVDNQMVLWDNLNVILRKSRGSEQDSSKVCDTILDNYAQSYYRPDSFTKPYILRKPTNIMTMRNEVSSVCSFVKEEFSVYLKYLDRIRLLARNNRFVFQIATYNYDLYRLMIITKVCQFLDMAGYLSNK